MALEKHGIVTLAAIALAATGCSGVEPLGTGSIALTWQVSPNGCEAAGVEAVEVRATGPHAIVERFPCEASAATFEGLSPGTYRVELLGFDLDGAPAYNSDPTRVEVVADRTRTVETVRLLAAPGAVEVEWAFGNGKVCGANDVRWVDLAAFDEFDYEVATARFPCDDGAGQILELRAGTYLIEAIGSDDTTARFRGQTRLKLARAEELVVDVTLEPL